MKNLKFTIFRTFLLLMICSFFVVPPCVSAAPADTEQQSEQYGITITLTFGSQDNSAVLATYQANAFTLEDADGNYALAEYSEAEQCYIVSGFTDDRSTGTQFHGGCTAAMSSELTIMGLPGGDYLLTHIVTQEGYMLLRDSIEISISDTEAIVDGYHIEKASSQFSGNIVALEIAIPQSFNLPMYGFCWHCWFMRIFGLDIIPFVGFLLLATSVAFLIFLWHRGKSGK